MIASNKKKYIKKLITLPQYGKKKIKGAHEQPHELLVCNYSEPKMQTVTRMDMVVIEDYYHMTTIDWMKLTYLLSSFYSSWRDAQPSLPSYGINAFIDYTCGGHTNSQAAILSWCGIVFPLGYNPPNASLNVT